MTIIGWIALAAAGLAALIALDLLLVHALTRRTWVIFNVWDGGPMFRVRARDSYEAIRIAHRTNGQTPPLSVVPLWRWKAARRADARALGAANRKVGRR